MASNYCEHVYKDMQAELCPLCGLPAHSTDWKLIAKLQKEFRKENPSYEYKWWSI